MDTCLYSFLIFQIFLLKPLVLALLGPGSSTVQVPTEVGSLWFSAAVCYGPRGLAASCSFQPLAGWLP